eukprot:TRINITY_DN801_c0_g1_i1.p2 TRINITY_DN801_c0_g1~~TRINITY_DN801_c0_g1_i1.p2  ORF type:complete len:997 (+),score=391.07 TRINITY_DN801_c0_g1_i1:3998-6988(+)
MDTSTDPSLSSSTTDAAAKQENKQENKEESFNVEDAIELKEVPSLLSFEERKNALKNCIRLISFKLNPTTMYSILQLCSSITKNYQLALQFIKEGGLRVILTLPPTCAFPNKVGVINGICRHLIEEPSILQLAMEAEIKSNLIKISGGGGGGRMAAIKPKSLLTALASFICRDCVVFLRASANTCRLNDPAAPETSVNVIPVENPNNKKPTKTEEALAAAIGSSNPAAVPAPGQPNTQPPSAIGSSGTPSNTQPQTGQTPTATQQASTAATTTERSKKSEADKKSSKSKSKRLIPSSVVQVISELTSCLVNPTSKDGKDASKSPAAATPKSRKGKEKVDDDSMELDINSSSSSTISINSSSGSVNNTTKLESTLSAVEIMQILTDIIYALPNCAHVLLRNKRKSKQQNVNFVRYVLSEFLPRKAGKQDDETGKQQNAFAVKMLTALAQKSEGRKKIISEALTLLQEEIDQRKQDRSSFPYTIHALIEFLYVLLAAREGEPSQSMVEVAKAMLDAGTIHILTSALKCIDLNHPEATSLVNTILKPLDLLTKLDVATGATKASALAKAAAALIQPSGLPTITIAGGNGEAPTTISVVTSQLLNSNPAGLGSGGPISVSVGGEGNSWDSLTLQSVIEDIAERAGAAMIEAQDDSISEGGDLPEGLGGEAEGEDVVDEAMERDDGEGDGEGDGEEVDESARGAPEDDDDEEDGEGDGEGDMDEDEAEDAEERYVEGEREELSESSSEDEEDLFSSGGINPFAGGRLPLTLRTDTDRGFDAEQPFFEFGGGGGVVANTAADLGLPDWLANNLDTEIGGAINNVRRRLSSGHRLRNFVGRPESVAQPYFLNSNDVEEDFRRLLGRAAWGRTKNDRWTDDGKVTVAMADFAQSLAPVYLRMLRKITGVELKKKKEEEERKKKEAEEKRRKEEEERKMKEDENKRKEEEQKKGEEQSAGENEQKRREEGEAKQKEAADVGSAPDQTAAGNVQAPTNTNTQGDGQ